MLKYILKNISSIRKKIKNIEKNIVEIRNENDLGKQTDLAQEKLVSGLNLLRTPCDELERIIDYSIWPLPTYKALLFKL